MKYLLIFLLFCTTQTSLANSPSKKSLSLKRGAEWILARDLTLQKTGLTPEEFVPYIRLWNLKAHSFMNSGSSSTDSCEFRTAISKKIMKQPSVKVKKTTVFKITQIQETTMSILVDIVSKDARKAGIDQIQITCSAYEEGLDSPELKQKFTENLSASLAAIFISKN